MIWVGTSGYQYAHWRGRFYPPGLAQRKELAFAVAALGSIEINASFYSLQRPAFYERFRALAPGPGAFAVKGGRFITHMKKLRAVDVALANFFASGVLVLGDSLGPVLWQFPQNMPADVARFEAFFELLPRTLRAAARFARRHADRGEPGGLPRRGCERPIRYAVEFRNGACASPELVSLLAQHGIAWVIAETAGRFPYLEQVTADLVYVRLHGDAQLYASGYSARAIARWADRIARWSRGGEPPQALHLYPARPRAARDVYVYFDNDGNAHAPRDALALRAALMRRGCEVALGPAQSSSAER